MLRPACRWRWPSVPATCCRWLKPCAASAQGTAHPLRRRPGKGHGLFEVIPVGSSANVLAESLKRVAATHYGHPLAAFLERLTADKAAAQTRIEAAMAGFLAPLDLHDAGGQVQRVARRFAVIAAAGELATDYGITGWNGGEARWAATTCFRKWLADPGNIRARKRGKTIGSFPELLKEMVKGYNSKEAAKMLIAAGRLTPASDGKSAQPIRVNGLARAGLYFIDGQSVFSHEG